MAQNILITRLVGLGDVASILLPAVRMVRRAEPDARIDVLTYQAGVELMSLCPDVNNVLSVSAEQWPSDLDAALPHFLDVARVVAMQGYDRIICLDTWFMPCFLARVLKDIGLNVEGNVIDLPVQTFLTRLQDGQLGAQYFQYTNFLESSFAHMDDWQRAWWETPSGHAHYPEFYLKHCCGFEGEVDISLPVAPDLDFRAQAQGRKIIALSLAGSKQSKRYRHAEALHQELEKAGYFVWSRFDGSQPMQTTLARLAATDLLVCVATSTQWLARLVGCPSLVIPGAMDPRVLGAQSAVDKHLACQYCCQTYCPAGADFACMSVPVDSVCTKVDAYWRQLA